MAEAMAHCGLMKHPKNLTAKIKALLDARGLSQNELARLAGVHQPRISEWFGGSGGPSLLTALRIARALGVPLEYLADDGQDAPDPALSQEEANILEMVRTLGVPEARRRLLQPTPELRFAGPPPAAGPIRKRGS